jgi:hypothetical protein
VSARNPYIDYYILLIVAINIAYFASLFRVEAKTALLLLPFMVILTVSVANFATYQVLAQSPTQSNERTFASSFQGIVDETGLLSHDYDAQVQKWQRGELSNETMASITETYLPKYQQLINRTNDLKTPTGYENVTNLYAMSLESELKSNIQFRDYLLTGNKTESEASMQSLSDAFRYEMDSFKAFNSASNATNK